MVEKFKDWQDDITSSRRGNLKIRVDQCEMCSHREDCVKQRNARILCDEFDSKQKIDFSNLTDKEKHIIGGLYGAFVGDALGVPYEFKTRSLLEKNPCNTMISFGSHGQPLGVWSDDSSMILATVDDIIDGYNLDSLARKFVNWMHIGQYSPFGEVFDIGNTTYESLMKYKYGNNPLNCGLKSPKASGNGSLMRILPMALYTWHKSEYIMHSEICNVSAITHGSSNCLIACLMYSKMVQALMEGNSREDSLEIARNYVKQLREDVPDTFERLLTVDFKSLDASKIKSSGFVIDTLEAAIWSFMNTDNYRDCVLKAVNLGDDTDTVSCVAGGLAGIYYGIDGIPLSWIHILARTHELNEIFTEFVKKVN